MGEPQPRDCLLLYIANYTPHFIDTVELWTPWMFLVRRAPFAIWTLPTGILLHGRGSERRGRPSLLDLLEAKYTNEALPNASVAGPCCWTELRKHRLTRASL